MNMWHYSLAFMGILVGIAACGAGDSTPAPSGANLIELRLVEDMPSEGSRQAILNDERLNLGSKPVISDADVRAIASEIRSGRLFLSIRLNEEGQRRLRRVTAENTGRRMAFVLDGRVRSAPVIRASISGDPMDISVEVPQSEAEVLVTKIRSRWEDPQVSAPG